MQISKAGINLNEQVSLGASSVLVDGDIILADNCPDMEEILCADAKAKITAKEYKNGKLMVTGVVIFTGLYMPDDKCSELKEISRMLDFSTNMDMNGNESTEFLVTATTEHIGFTLVNSRKLSVKVMVSVKASGYNEKLYEPINEISDAEFIEKKYSMYVPVSATCTTIEVDDLLTVPEDMEDIGEILKVTSRVTPGDVRVMNGKAMVQGELHLNTIYTAADEKGSVCCVEHKVPFTEIVEAPNADELCSVDVDFNVLEVNANIKGDINGDTKIISIESKIEACVKVTKAISEKIIADCYSLQGTTEIKRDKMTICENVVTDRARISRRQQIEPPQNVRFEKLISCTANPIIKSSMWEDGTAKIEGILVVYLIYRDDSGVIRCAVTEQEFDWKKSISTPCNIDASVRLKDVVATLQGDKAEILANIDIDMKASTFKEVDILVDCDIKEEESTNSMPAMVIYFAKEGDTLWDVAKKYRTKSEKIKKVNNLETETIEQGRRLLIPTM